MKLYIKCVSCNKKFFGYSDTIKVYGTIVETNCPHCNKYMVSNLSKFCEGQIGEVDNRLNKARLMLKLSRDVSKLFNNDYKK